MSIFGELRDIYERGENISMYLKQNPGLVRESGLSASDAIAISYDLQAGSYVRGFYSNYGMFQEFNKFILSQLGAAGVLDEIASSRDGMSLCDLGTGEATNYASFLNLLPDGVRRKTSAYGMDISLSRIDVAKSFLAIEARSNAPYLFLGDLRRLPLLNRSIDIVLTMHALEPNGGAELQILNEIIRVSNRYIVMAEPIYETAAPEQKKRMEHFGYIRELRTLLHASSDIEIISECLLPESLCANPLNRATVFIAKKRSVVDAFAGPGRDIFACPVGLSKLVRKNGFWLSGEGSCYPEINHIPVLRANFALPYYRQSGFPS